MTKLNDVDDTMTVVMSCFHSKMPQNYPLYNNPEGKVW